MSDKHFDKKIVDLDYWRVEEFPLLLHKAKEHDDFDADMALTVVHSVLKEIANGKRETACLSCSRDVRPRMLAHGVVFVIGWATGDTFVRDGDIVRHEISAGMAVCPRCDSKGPSYVQARTLERLWSMWPTALAIRVRHDAKARQEAEGTSEQ